MSKLDWVYDDRTGEQIATINDDIRIRAVQDESPSNPFEDHDGNWPIVVRSPDTYRSDFTEYGGEDLRTPWVRFTTAQLIHDQVIIAKLFETTVAALIECYGNSDDALPEGKRLCREPEVLREVFTAAHGDMSDREAFELLPKVYDLLGIINYATTSRGYSQGDYVELFTIAPPAMIEQFGTNMGDIRIEVLANLTRAEICSDRLDQIVADKIAERLLKPTTDTYGAWAWGDVYGYVIERVVERDEDGDPTEWEETDSCWGYYGTDHSESGLEEQALSCLPTEVRELEDA